MSSPVSPAKSAVAGSCSRTWGCREGAVGFGDVGRVADDGVEGSAVRVDGGEEIGEKELDATGYVVVASIVLCDGEGIEG